MTPALFYPLNRSQFFKQLAATFMAKQIWTWVVKRSTYHRFSTRSAAMLQSRLHVFVAPFAVALLIVSDLLLAPSICFFCALMGSRTKKLICLISSTIMNGKCLDHANNIWFRLAVSFVNCKRKWKLCYWELEDNSRPCNKTVQIKSLSFPAPFEITYLV